MAEGSPSPLYSKTQSPVGSSQYPYLFFFVNPPHYAHLYNLYYVCLPAMLRKMWVMDSLTRGGLGWGKTIFDTLIIPFKTSSHENIHILGWL